MVWPPAMSTVSRCRRASHGSTRFASACSATRSGASSVSNEPDPLNLFRYAVPGQYGLGHRRRPGQERVRADERLAYAAVDLDAEPADHHPRVRTGEVLLRHRDHVDQARLESDRDAGTEVVAQTGHDALGQRRNDIGADEPDRRIYAHRARQ